MDWLIEYNQPQNEPTQGALKDYEEEDCGSGTEADNEETEEEGDYDQDDEDRENRFFHDNADDGPRDMEVSLHEEMQIERPSSRAGCENGKRRRVE
jgi:hypothetical protein